MIRRGLLAGRALGLGCAQLGDLFRPLADDEAHQIVDAAWEAGVRYFDTAPHYGVGLSEQRLGASLADRPRSEYVVSTKVGRLLEPTVTRSTEVRGARGEGFQRVWDFSRDGVLRSLEQSLERLGLDRVDILLMHDVGDRYRQALDHAVPALIELREQGVIGAIGAGDGNASTLTRFVREADIDVVLEAGRYTLLDRTAEAELLPACESHDVAVIAAGVYNTGVLATSAPAPGANFEYAQVDDITLARAQRMARLCAERGVDLPTAALRFPLRRRPVATVLVGADSADQITESAQRLDGDVPAGLWEELDRVTASG